MALRLEMKGVVRTRERLQRLAGKIEDMSDLWPRMGDVLADLEEGWFMSEGYGTWDQLAESTAKYKAAHGFPDLILQRTEQLRESLTDPLEAMQVGQGRSTLGTFTRNSMTWGTDVRDPRPESSGQEYAHFHQGTDGVTGEPTIHYNHWSGELLPVRQPIPWPLPINWQVEMDHAAEEWLDEAVRESAA